MHATVVAVCVFVAVASAFPQSQILLTNTQQPQYIQTQQNKQQYPHENTPLQNTQQQFQLQNAQDPKYIQQQNAQQFAQQSVPQFQQQNTEPQYIIQQQKNNPQFQQQNIPQQNFQQNTQPQYIVQQKNTPSYIQQQKNTQQFQAQNIPQQSFQQNTQPQYIQNEEPHLYIPILSKTEIRRPDQSFDLKYDTADGQAFAEKAVLQRNRDNTGDVLVRSGSYGYTAPDGTPISVSYIADENGFRASGAHIPVAPAPTA